MASSFFTLYKNLLNEANLADKTPLIRSLEEILNSEHIPTDSPVYGWVTEKIPKWYASAEDDQQKSVRPHSYAEGEPDYMKKEGIVDFVGFSNAEKDHIKSLIHYLAYLRGAELKALDKQTYKQILPKFKKYNEGLKSNDREKQSRTILSTLQKDVDYAFVVEAQQAPVGFEDLTWIKLLTDKAAKAFGGLLQNCIGKQYLPTKTTEIFALVSGDSLMPYVAVGAKSKKILEIKGKSNVAPLDRYVPATKEFVKQLLGRKFTVEGDGEHIGMLQYEDKFYFPEDDEWKTVWKTKILPKQANVLKALKARIVETPDESPTDGNVFESMVSRVLESLDGGVETLPMPTTKPQPRTVPTPTPGPKRNPLMDPSPGRKSKPKAKKKLNKQFWTDLVRRHNL